jgi:Uma2 family endonuclease
VDGELFTAPRPANRHAIASSGLGSYVLPAYHRGDGGPGGWWIIFEPELHLGRDIMVPDLAGWRRERMPEYPDGAFVEIAPDWVCEVASPSTTRLDRVRKMPKYAQNGIGHLWLIDPTPRTLEVYRRADDHWLLVATHGDDERVRAEPFEAIEIALEHLWS